MADLVEKTVTSYFRVRDVRKFKKIMEVFEHRVSYETDDKGRLRLSIHTGGWGAFDSAQNTDVSLLDILRLHLKPGQSCTLMSVSYASKGDCVLSVAGFAAVVTSKGVLEMSLHDILDQAKKMKIKASNPDFYT